MLPRLVLIVSKKFDTLLKNASIFSRRMQPAVCTIGSEGDPIPHWRAPEVFFSMHMSPKKQIPIYFSICGWKNSAEGFLTMKDHLSFLY